MIITLPTVAAVMQRACLQGRLKVRGPKHVLPATWSTNSTKVFGRQHKRFKTQKGVSPQTGTAQSA